MRQSYHPLGCEPQVCPGEGTDMLGDPTVGVGLHDVPALGPATEAPGYRKPLSQRPSVKFNIKWSEAVAPKGAPIGESL